MKPIITIGQPPEDQIWTFRKLKTIKTSNILERNKKLEIPRKLKPVLQKLRRKQAFTLENRTKKNKKFKTRADKRSLYCEICEISCNGSRTFYELIESKTQKTRFENKGCTPSVLRVTHVLIR